jgi:archaemetzincin
MKLKQSTISRLILYGLLLFLSAVAVNRAQDKKPRTTMPSAKQRRAALGKIEQTPALFKKAIESFKDFEILPAPSSGDWLADHVERGQTYDQFIESEPNRPDKTRDKLYFQPIGPFPKEAPSLKKLERCASLYFGLKVVFLKAVTVAAMKAKTRINSNSVKVQIRTRGILRYLSKNLPADAYCCLGITMTDLYPSKKWNYVFGIASLRERIGVYSFARYDPAFYGQKRDAGTEVLILLRACKVLVHEAAHMFGLNHCLYFKCVMNGANHLQESDSQPMGLCPICLRKLHYSHKFDVGRRYSGLHNFYKRNGLTVEAKWLTKRLMGLGLKLDGTKKTP